jgi:ABC-type lipoprotein export system ATPase subunit
MALTELGDVSKTYDLGELKVHALRDASLWVDEGQCVAVIERSGSGKSTLTNILVCLGHPTAGSLRKVGKKSADSAVTLA